LGTEEDHDFRAAGSRRVFMKLLERFPHLKGDLAGGITSSLLTLPKGMALGALIFAPLGPEHIPTGIAAALIALFMTNLVGALAGNVPIMINAPFSISTLMLLSVTQTLSVDLQAEGLTTTLVPTLMALFFFTVVVSGAFQVLFGLLRLGNLAKYIPYPVLSGLMTGTAILILAEQIKIFVGLEGEKGFSALFAHLDQIQIPTLVTGLVTCLAIQWGPRLLTRKIPDPFYGMALGTACYYLFLAFGLGDSLGSLVGEIPASIPTPSQAVEMAELVADSRWHSTLWGLVPLALSIAAIDSLRGMVAIVTADNLTRQRSNPSRELVGHGLGNLASGLFGGITTTGSLPNLQANWRYGGRTRASRAVSGVFSLAILLALHPVVSFIPKVVLAGMLVMIALAGFDKLIFELLAQIWRHGRKTSKEILIDVGVVLLVIGVLIGQGIFEAIGAGFALSILIFVVRMGKEIVRRQYSADQVRSNVTRLTTEIEMLEREGKKIHVLELEGAFFFGTADKIAALVDELFKRDVQFIVLDFKRVTDVDSTGAAILRLLREKCADLNRHLIVSGVGSTATEIRLGELIDLLEKMEAEQQSFANVDDALAWAEDRLLDTLLGADRYEREVELRQVGALSALTEEETRILKGYLLRRTFPDGDFVFRQGDTDLAMFFIVRGRAHVHLHVKQENISQRLGTLCPGTLFGEMALISRAPRAASVVAEGSLTCYQVSDEMLRRLNAEHPEIAYKVLIGVAKELAERIRIANRMTALLKA
jgi:SulP family sulfate permease